MATWLSPELDDLPATEISWEVSRSALTDALGTAGPPILVEIAGDSLDDLRRGAGAGAGPARGAAGAVERALFLRRRPGGTARYLGSCNGRRDGRGPLAVVSRVLEASLDGRIATRLSTGDEERPGDHPPARTASGRSRQRRVRTDNGQHVAIGEVAKFTHKEGAREVFRRDQRRTAQVTAQLTQGVNQAEAVAAVQAILKDVPLPPRAACPAARPRRRAGRAPSASCS